MIVIIGKKDWVLAQINHAANKFTTLGEWHKHYNIQPHAGRPLVLLQKVRIGMVIAPHRSELDRGMLKQSAIGCDVHPLNMMPF